MIQGIYSRSQARLGTVEFGIAGEAELNGLSSHKRTKWYHIGKYSLLLWDIQTPAVSKDKNALSKEQRQKPIVKAVRCCLFSFKTFQNMSYQNGSQELHKTACLIPAIRICEFDILREGQIQTHPSSGWWLSTCEIKSKLYSSFLDSNYLLFKNKQTNKSYWVKAKDNPSPRLPHCSPL